MESNDDLFDPYIAVNVKEAMNTPGEPELSFGTPPIICSRRQFKILLLFQKYQKRHDVS